LPSDCGAGVWSWHTQSHAVVALQLGLAALNARGLLKGEQATRAPAR
jgi:predicted metalloprotease